MSELDDIRNSLKLLATKDDLNTIFDSLYAKIKTELTTEFETQLAERDTKITELESRISKIENGTPLAPHQLAPQEWDVDEEREEYDLLLIGDSIIRDVDVEKLNPDKRNDKVFLPGKKTEHIREELKERAKKNSYGNIIIHCASNNIPRDPPAMVADNLINLVGEVKKNMPNAHVHVSAVLPKMNASFLPGINEINFRLLQASGHLGFNVIQHPQMCSKGIFYMSMYKRHEVHDHRPVHLSPKGVIRFGSNIKYSLHCKKT